MIDFGKIFLCSFVCEGVRRYFIQPQLQQLWKIEEEIGICLICEKNEKRKTKKTFVLLGPHFAGHRVIRGFGDFAMSCVRLTADELETVNTQSLK